MKPRRALPVGSTSDATHYPLTPMACHTILQFEKSPTHLPSILLNHLPILKSPNSNPTCKKFGLQTIEVNPLALITAHNTACPSAYVTCISVMEICCIVSNINVLISTVISACLFSVSRRWALLTRVRHLPRAFDPRRSDRVSTGVVSNNSSTHGSDV
jgi:hypothetical protein